MNPFQHRAVQPNPAVSEQVVAGMCIAAGIDPQESFTRDEMIQLLRGCNYHVVPATISEFERKDRIDVPADDVWTAPHVHQFVSGLEIRRRWLPTPNKFHDPKKSATRLMIEQAAAQGVNDPIADLDKHSLEDLLLQIAMIEDRQVREALYETIKLKMSVNGWVEE